MNYSGPTPDRLLDAGWTLFAREGYDRTSVRAITRAARANLGAVTYHFGTKEKLYHAVLERLFRQMGDRLTEAARTAGPPPARVAALVGAMFSFFAEHPDAPRIVLQQITRGGAMPAGVTEQVRANLAIITGVIADGQARGAFRPGNPLFGAFSIISQAVWFAVARRTFVQVTEGLSNPDLAPLFERHIADLVARGLATGPEPRP